MSENAKNNQNVVKCGFAEIDDFFGGFKGGEVIGICGLRGYYNTFFANIIYSVNKEFDKYNRKNIHNLAQGIKKQQELEDTRISEKIKVSLVISPNLIFSFCPFPYIPYYAEKDDLKFNNKLFGLFQSLPIISGANQFMHNISLYIKHLGIGFNIDISAMFVVLVAISHKEIQYVRKLAEELQIPAFVWLPDKYDANKTNSLNLRKIEHIGYLAQFIDKFVVLKKKYKETHFMFYDKNKHYSHNCISAYAQQDLSYPYIELIDKGDEKITTTKMPIEILNLMAKHSCYLNKKNFSAYMGLKPKANREFWDYIEVFQRLQFEELYEHIAEYKGDKADKNELFLAASVLYKLRYKRK